MEEWDSGNDRSQTDLFTWSEEQSVTVLDLSANICLMSHLKTMIRGPTPQRQLYVFYTGRTPVTIDLVTRSHYGHRSTSLYDIILVIMQSPPAR